MKHHHRIVIVGGPSTGKTTLSLSIGGIVRHTDEVKHLDWESSKIEVTKWLNKPFDVIEGVLTARALRQWMRDNPSGKPCTTVILLTKPIRELTSGQARLASGIYTIFRGIESDLQQRGTLIDRR